MSMLPRMYKASTREKAEAALLAGKLFYPAFCYITSENIMSWVDADNKINYIISDKQITDVEYDNGHLSFLAGDEVIESVDIVMRSEDAQRLISQIQEHLVLEEYAKKPEVASMIDNAIGDLDGADSVIDYIEALSYNRLRDIPIKNESGSLTKAVVLSSLMEGAYKVTGQYVVGGSNETVFTATEPTFALVTHGESDSKITVITSNTIRLYYVAPNGECTSDKYTTENYVSENYTTTKDMMEYVVSTIGDMTPSIVKRIMEENFDSMLSERLEAVPLTSILDLWGKG